MLHILPYEGAREQSPREIILDRDDRERERKARLAHEAFEDSQTLLDLLAGLGGGPWTARMDGTRPTATDGVMTFALVHPDQAAIGCTGARSHVVVELVCGRCGFREWSPPIRAWRDVGEVTGRSLSPHVCRRAGR